MALKLVPTFKGFSVAIFPRAISCSRDMVPQAIAYPSKLHLIQRGPD